MFLFIGLLFTSIVTVVPTVMTHVTLPESDHPIEIYSNQQRDDLTLLYKKAIGSAERSILLLIYSLKDREIIQALNAKSRANIPIRIICDKEASAGVRKKLDPAIQVTPSTHKGLMHLKILVIDEERVLVGSANLTGDSLRLHGNLVAGFENQDLAKMALAWADGSWRSKSETFRIGNQTLEFFFLPGNPEALHRLKQVIRSAKKTIHVAMYTFTRFDLINTLGDAAKRGVSVTVVVDGHSAKGASQQAIKRLLQEGIEPRMSTGSELLHHKMMIVDDAVLVAGSTNWTKAAFQQNDDCFFILSDLTDDQRQKLRSIWEVILHESTL